MYTPFFVHGFLGNCSDGWTTELMKVWSNAQGINACCVDWSYWSQCFYFKAANDYVYKVGAYLADVIGILLHTYGVQLAQIQLMGHSLGAHVIGTTGMYFPDPKVPICTGKTRKKHPKYF